MDETSFLGDETAGDGDDVLFDISKVKFEFTKKTGVLDLSELLTEIKWMIDSRIKEEQSVPWSFVDS